MCCWNCDVSLTVTSDVMGLSVSQGCVEQGGGNQPELQLHESLTERLREVNFSSNTT